MKATDLRDPRDRQHASRSERRNRVTTYIRKGTLFSERGRSGRRDFAIVAVSDENETFAQFTADCVLDPQRLRGTR